MLDHVAIQAHDVAASSVFYDAVFAPLGYRRVMEYDGNIGYGDGKPDFWLGRVTTEGVAREAHLAFQARDRDAVVAFFEAAVAVGAEVLHAPRVWPEYHEHYFGAFVRDPDGNNVEACCHATP